MVVTHTAPTLMEKHQQENAVTGTEGLETESHLDNFHMAAITGQDQWGDAIRVRHVQALPLFALTNLEQELHDA